LSLFFNSLTTRNHQSSSIFNILPVSGEFPEGQKPVSAWNQDLEVAHPYYYSTWLEDFNIHVEYAPGEKSGFYRFIIKMVKLEIYF
jgi:hypothetical protein